MFSHNVSGEVPSPEDSLQGHILQKALTRLSEQVCRLVCGQFPAPLRALQVV